MSNPEAKEVFVPFPIDPNKYEINKWMAQAGLPVPRIFPSAEEAQEALKSGIQIMARGYLVDNRVSRERPYCADELLIDVLQTECFDIETVSYFKKEIIRLTEEGNSLLTSPGLITYCHEVGINPADLRAKYFFQERIIPPNKEFPISVLTGNFTLDNISVEVQQSGHQYGNFFYSEHGMQSGNQKWDISARAGFELHCQAQPLLEAANGYKFWHMEMVPNFNDNTSDEIEQIFLVQARRIPAKVKLSPSADKQFEQFSFDLRSLKTKEGIDFQDLVPYILIIEIERHDKGYVSINNRYGKLKGIVFSCPTDSIHTLLTHGFYRLIALAGTKGAEFIIKRGRYLD